MKKITKQLRRFFCDKDDVNRYFLTGEKLKEQLTTQQKMEIINQSIFFDQEYFKKKGNAFDIKNKDLDRDNTANVISAYSDEAIFVKDVPYSSSIIVFESMVFQWDIGSFNDNHPNNFKILELIQPKPEYVIIGTEVNKKQLKKETADYLERVIPNINVDTLDFFTAVSTFNSCMTDNIKAVVFLSLRQLSLIKILYVIIIINDWQRNIQITP